MDSEHIRFVHGNKEDFDAGKAKHLVHGCVNNGVPEDVAEAIWEKMTKFAEYAFNRSHAACYAYIAYITAYMACHWPEEFFAAMLNAFIENSDKMKSYLGHAAKRGIQLEIPDIQRSECKFKAENNAILYGLQGIKGLKSQAVDIVADRKERGPYQDFQDLYERMAQRDNLLDKTSIEGLIYSGALNSFSENKAALFKQAEAVKKSHKKNASDFAMGQLCLFSENDLKIPLPDAEPFSTEFALEKEYEVLGMFVSSPPTDRFADFLAKQRKIKPLEKVAETTKYMKSVRTIGLVRNLKPFLNKNGNFMASFDLETRYAKVSCVIFPEAYEAWKQNLSNNAVVCVEGSWSKDNRDENAMQLLVREVRYPEFNLMEKDEVKPVRIHISSKEEQNEVLAFIQQNEGNVPVVLVANGKDFPIKTRVQVNETTKKFFSAYR